jgi:peptidoglycan/xylan/chitin deacetylase (PgdA/CDA1 family)
VALPLRPPVVLGYHGIARVRAEDDPVWLFVPPDKLERQIARMKRRGYRFVTMTDFARRLTAGEDLTATCALTFDDGTLDQLEALAPLLRSMGDLPGTVYVCPGLLGQPYPWAGADAGVRFMDEDELHELAGFPNIEIGSHTINHTVLETASGEEAYREMSSCKERLEEMLNRPVPSFCYPRCRYSPACPDAAERAGYTSAVTCGPRGSWTPFELKREVIHSPDGSLTFELKARGLYQSLVDLPPTRLARWATRAYRHRSSQFEAS